VTAAEAVEGSRGGASGIVPAMCEGPGVIISEAFLSIDRLELCLRAASARLPMRATQGL
jgi:hypothetical protein